MSDKTFEQYVDDWDRTVGELTKLKSQIKSLGAAELKMRRAIADSVATAMGDEFKEGTNTFEMKDGRTLKVVNKINRQIEVSELDNVRTLYGQLNSTTVPFDDLLRVKYELSKRDFDKLDDAGAKVVSRMLVTKPGAPEVKFG